MIIYEHRKQTWRTVVGRGVRFSLFPHFRFVITKRDKDSDATDVDVDFDCDTTTTDRDANANGSDASTV